MKHKFAIFLIFIVIMPTLLMSCSKKITLTAIVVNNNDGMLFICEEGDPTTLYSVSINHALLFSSNQEKPQLDDFSTGEFVEIIYDGGIKETYPMGISNCISIKLLHLQASHDIIDESISHYNSIINNTENLSVNME